jgi:hypothetical protein
MNRATMAASPRVGGGEEVLHSRRQKIRQAPASLQGPTIRKLSDAMLLCRGRTLQDRLGKHTTVQRL